MIDKLNNFLKSKLPMIRNFDYVIIDQFNNSYLLEGIEPYQHMKTVVIDTSNGLKELSFSNTKAIDIFNSIKKNNNVPIAIYSVNAIGTYCDFGYIDIKTGCVCITEIQSTNRRSKYELPNSSNLNYTLL